LNFYHAENRLKGLNSISEAFRTLSIKFAIFDGALLGFIRDGKLIEWDWDAEIALNYEDYEKNLIKIIEEIDKCKIGKLILNPNPKNPKITILTSRNDFGNFKYAITPFKLSNDKKTIYRELYKYPSKYLKDLKNIKIDKYSFPIPRNAEELLFLQYGENWMTPLKSTVKDEYLSKKVYTKSNNQINQKIIYLLQVKSKIKKKLKSILRNLIKKYPILEYRLGLNREQLFIYQLINLLQTSKKSKIIEIGSSDLSEFETLNAVLKNIKFKTTIYEATKRTFNQIKKKKTQKKYKNLKIINKAVIPRAGNYILNHDKESHLNSIANNKNISIEKTKILKNTILFDQIKELNNQKINKILKMDIEGIEEEMIIHNIDFLKKLEKINIVLEVHPNKYKKPYSLYKSLNILIDNGYQIKFVELAKFCNTKILNKYLISNRIIKSNNGRYLVKNPNRDILKDVCFCDYNLINKYPYYVSKNVRSLTLTRL
tara:strand:+ start:9165 stop:10619 length:1455 start_codon:yes stop_codon:yes gene_type:complete